MPTKLKKPITITIHHVENAVATALYLFENDLPVGARHNRMCNSGVNGEVFYQIESALKAQGIDYETWEPPQPLKVGTHEVKEYGSDGSVQVGCTRVDRVTLEAIYKASTAAMTQAEPEWPKWFYNENATHYCYNLARVDDLRSYQHFDSRNGNKSEVYRISHDAVEAILGLGYNPIPATTAREILGRK